jgi:hypothetical protein
MFGLAPNWAEQVVAIATAVLALGVFGAVAAAVFGAQQVREARRTHQAQMAAEFLRRWNEDSLVEARPLIASSNPTSRGVSRHACRFGVNRALLVWRVAS